MTLCPFDLALRDNARHVMMYLHTHNEVPMGKEYILAIGYSGSEVMA